ncbi:hypothetical protein IF1G_00856 [Cordyceps javanica]|uniref:Uncharacterized protein n=1 Tax=Cordyceps javanica TaxID=43265 RepID=A0A545VGT0_9HYPO|nr:hypothetical protein IF1G_00856 [Cordyceps javanica]
MEGTTDVSLGRVQDMFERAQYTSQIAALGLGMHRRFEESATNPAAQRDMPGRAIASLAGVAPLNHRRSQKFCGMITILARHAPLGDDLGLTRIVSSACGRMQHKWKRGEEGGRRESL